MIPPCVANPRNRGGAYHRYRHHRLQSSVRTCHPNRPRTPDRHRPGNMPMSSTCSSEPPPPPTTTPPCVSRSPCTTGPGTCPPSTWPENGRFIVEHVRGRGSEHVYAYYLPIYRHLADLAGSADWPIKVGRASAAWHVRITQQLTAMPEAPVVGVLILTPDSAVLERALLSALALRGKRLDAGGGSEWFMTNPDEVVDLYESVARALPDRR